VSAPVVLWPPATGIFDGRDERRDAARAARPRRERRLVYYRPSLSCRSCAQARPDLAARGDGPMCANLRSLRLKNRAPLFPAAGADPARLAGSLAGGAPRRLAGPPPRASLGSARRHRLWEWASGRAFSPARPLPPARAMLPTSFSPVPTRQIALLGGLGLRPPGPFVAISNTSAHPPRPATFIAQHTRSRASGSAKRRFYAHAEGAKMTFFYTLSGCQRLKLNGKLNGKCRSNLVQNQRGRTRTPNGLPTRSYRTT